MRIILAFMAALLSAAPALAQTYVPFGSIGSTTQAIGNGYNATNGTLFGISNAVLEQNAPMTLAFWVTYNIGAIKSQQTWVGKNAGSTGYLVVINNTQSNDMPFQWVTEPSGGGGCSSTASIGRTCTRNKWVADGSLHHVCATLSASQNQGSGTGTQNSGIVPTLIIDGIVRDQNVGGGIYTPAVGTFLQVGVGGENMLLQDLRIYKRELAQNECAALYSLGLQNIVPNAGSLQTGLVGWWPFSSSTCTGSPIVCTEASGSGAHNLIVDGPPTVAILTPSNGATLTGTTSLTASCSDAISCTQVVWEVNGAVLNVAFTAPYTYSWNTTRIVDGTYTLSAVATNAGGSSNTASISVTVSNGRVSQAWYFSPTGSDANDCKSSGTPCLTVTKLNSITYLGSDSVNFDNQHGTFPISTVGINFCSEVNVGDGCSTQNFYPAAAPLVVQSYGGGTCAAIAGTLTGCALLQLSAGSTIISGVAFNGGGNATVQNLQIVGGQTAALAFANVSQTAGGVYINNKIPSTVYTVQNNYIKDWASDIASRTRSANATFTVQNNFLTGSTNTTTVGFGYGNTGNGTITFQGNLCTNLGGYPASTPGFINIGTGTCFVNDQQFLLSPGFGFGPWQASVVQFNVSHEIGKNQTSCGGGVHYWLHASGYFTYQFNEGYNYLAAAGCDGGMYDADYGASNTTFQYSYGHDNFGYCGVHLNADDSSTTLPFNNITFRYNICENNGNSGTGAQNAGLAEAFGSSVPLNDFYYNNTIYSSQNGSGATPHPQCFVDGGSNSIGLYWINNLCVRNSQTWAAATIFLWTSATNGDAGLVSLTNGYYSPSGGNLFRIGQTTNYSSVASWTTATGLDVGSISTNPLLTSAGGGGTCYTSGIPAGPQPCPSAYVYSSTSSPAIGVGTDLTVAPYNQTITRDFYGNTVPHIHGTGWNIGADGGYP